MMNHKSISGMGGSTPLKKLQEDEQYDLLFKKESSPRKRVLEK